jgi:hypothetical protein
MSRGALIRIKLLRGRKHTRKASRRKSVPERFRRNLTSRITRRAVRLRKAAAAGLKTEERYGSRM